MQVIIDERADARQGDALIKVLYGEETEEGATHWCVYHALCDKLHEPLFRPIDYEVDIKARTARVVIPGVLESGLRGCWRRIFRLAAGVFAESGSGGGQQPLGGPFDQDTRWSCAYPGADWA